jgi:hypothetical protein
MGKHISRHGRGNTMDTRYVTGEHTTAEGLGRLYGELVEEGIPDPIAGEILLIAARELLASTQGGFSVADPTEVVEGHPLTPLRMRQGRVSA